MSEQLLTLPSSTKSISKLEEFIQCVAKEHNICEDKFPDILISLTEAVNNAIVHGNKNDENKYVSIILSKTTKGLSFQVSDEGPGFNPKSFLNEGRTVEMHFSV